MLALHFTVTIVGGTGHGRDDLLVDMIRLIICFRLEYPTHYSLIILFSVLAGYSLFTFNILIYYFILSPRWLFTIHF